VTATVTPFSIGTSGSRHDQPAKHPLPQERLYLRDGGSGAARWCRVRRSGELQGSGYLIRVVRQYTINNDQIPARFDVLFGWAPLYQELACRVAA
jgi:hypothetical protein